MVINKLKKQLGYIIKKYGINSTQAYHMSVRISIELDRKNNSGTLQCYYNDSLEELIKYIRENENNPSEVRWNKYAITKGYLSSQTIGYIYGDGFNKLCKEIRKELKKQ